MGSLGSPQIWVPYLTNKDCSLGFCSLYCPQWCYIVEPPPPPPLIFSAARHNPSPIKFSSLVVAIVGILVSAFLLVTYYVLLFKHCGNDSNGRTENPSNGYESDNPRLDEATFTGLDETLIKAIKVSKYKKDGGFTDNCSVCLSEFREDESLRVLPQCGHSFHVQCIDMWLRSHSNCPLCRANVASVVGGAIEPRPLNGESTDSSDHQGRFSENSDSRVLELVENHNTSVMPPKSSSNSSTTTSLSSLSDLGNLEERQSVVIEVRDEIRRSISMEIDFFFRDQSLVANEREEEEEINVVVERDRES